MSNYRRPGQVRSRGLHPRASGTSHEKVSAVRPEDPGRPHRMPLLRRDVSGRAGTANPSCPALVNLLGPWWPAVRPPGPMINVTRSRLLGGVDCADGLTPACRGGIVDIVPTVGGNVGEAVRTEIEHAR